jgi:dihydroxyacetone kinase phosphoprotein-dependent L subunit
VIEKFSIDESTKMFMYVSERMIGYRDRLTQADKAIGDGDHGVNMARGFSKVKAVLEERRFTTTGDLLNSIGQTLLASVGGAAGVVFGMFFIGGAKGQEASYFDAGSLSSMLTGGLETVRARGNASPGDKTMIDALWPAAQKALEMKNASLGVALVDVAAAAKNGMMETKSMVATTGKAKSLGERSIGFSDPGSISLYLIIKSMSKYAEAAIR